MIKKTLFTAYQCLLSKVQNLFIQGHIARGELEPPWMKWHFVQGSMESRHFESQSATKPPLSLPHFENLAYAPVFIWTYLSLRNENC